MKLVSKIFDTHSRTTNYWHFFNCQKFRPVETYPVDPTDRAPNSTRHSAALFQRSPKSNGNLTRYTTRTHQTAQRIPKSNPSNPEKKPAFQQPHPPPFRPIKHSLIKFLLYLSAHFLPPSSSSSSQSLHRDARLPPRETKNRPGAPRRKRSTSKAPGSRINAPV